MRIRCDHESRTCSHGLRLLATWIGHEARAFRRSAGILRHRPSTEARPGSRFSFAFVFGCDLIQTESEIAKVNRRTPGEASFGPDFRPRDHWGRHQRLRHRARCGGPGQFRFPLRNERFGERDVVLVDQARAWRAALSRILRVPAGPRGADRARNPLADRAPHHPSAAFRAAAPCRVAPGLAAAARAVSLRPYRRPPSAAADALGRSRPATRSESR